MKCGLRDERMGIGVFNTLDTFIRSDVELTWLQLCTYSGYTNRYLYDVMSMCIRLGLVVRLRFGVYQITERGRIAHALQSACNARRAQARKEWKAQHSYSSYSASSPLAQ